MVDGCATATATSYVVQADHVDRVGDLAEARDAHTATLLDDGRVLVTGGFAGEGRPPLRSAEVFDPATGECGRSVPSPSGTYTATTELFDPATSRFGPARTLLVARLSGR